MRTLAVAALLASSWWLGVAGVVWGSQRLTGDMRCNNGPERL